MLTSNIKGRNNGAGGIGSGCVKNVEHATLKEHPLPVQSQCAG